MDSDSQGGCTCATGSHSTSFSRRISGGHGIARSMPILAKFWFSEKFLRLQNENETLQANFKAGFRKSAESLIPSSS